jgi:AraC-like DNA-binding protein
MLKRFLQSSLSVPDHYLTASAGVSENAMASPVNAKKPMSLFAPLASSLWTQVQGYGLDAASLFKEAGVDPELIFDSGARIPNERFEHLFDRAIELSHDPLFGLRAEEHFRPAHLGALGFAWLASSTIRMAFTRMSRYARMINDHLTVTLTDQGENLVVTFDAHRPSRHAAIREDLQLSIATNCCRALAGNRFHPALLRFTHAEPAETGYYDSLFRCPFEFGAASTSMLIKLEVASQRLTGSNEELAGLNEHIVVRYLAHAAKTDIVNRAKAAIIDGLASAGVTELRIAEALHMTARNLHRKLHKENTSFKFLLNEVRQELAEQYIRDRSITLTEMSFMLGFSEVSSFSRAYKNWTGKAPSAVRGVVARNH